MPSGLRAGARKSVVWLVSAITGLPRMAMIARRVLS